MPLALGIHMGIGIGFGIGVYIAFRMCAIAFIGSSTRIVIDIGTHKCVSIGICNGICVCVFSLASANALISTLAII